MRLESNHRELLEKLERRALSLSTSGDHTSVLKTIVEDAQELRVACSALRELEETTRTLTEFENFVAAIQRKNVPLDDKAGGLILHTINTFRHSLNKEFSSDTITKILIDLRRVMATLVSKAQKNIVPLSPAVLEFREAFLKDETGTFDRVSQIGVMFSVNPRASLEDPQLLIELFRLFHTIKGNAAALGFRSLTEYAHAVEEALQSVQDGKLAKNPTTARFFKDCTEDLKLVVGAARAARTIGIDSMVERVREFAGMPAQIKNTSAQSEVIADAIQERTSGFFLSIRIKGESFLIPSESVMSVVRNPQILSVPGKKESWNGVIRAGGDLIPLVNASALVNVAGGHEAQDTNDHYVVVLKGKSDSKFGVPVDGVGNVSEWTASMQDVIVLDVPTMLQKISI